MKIFFIKILNKLGLLKYLNLHFSVRFNNKKIYIPVINGIGKNSLFIAEGWKLSIFKLLLNLKEGTFIDVGVNIGQTLVVLKSADFDKEYIGFEPNPSCLYYLKQFISRNKFTNTTIYPVGLADKTQVFEFNFYDDNATDTSASIISDIRDSSTIYRTEFVPCFKFSDLNLPELKAISIIKIDVEGAELEVLNSLADSIIKYRPFILIEILPVYDISNTTRLNRQKAIEELLVSWRYKIFRIHKQVKSAVIRLEELAEIGVHDQIDLIDYILSPEEIASRVKL